MRTLHQKTHPSPVDSRPSKVTELLGSFAGQAWRYVETLAGVHRFVACSSAGKSAFFADAELATFLGLSGYRRIPGYFNLHIANLHRRAPIDVLRRRKEHSRRGIAAIVRRHLGERAHTLSHTPALSIANKAGA